MEGKSRTIDSFYNIYRLEGSIGGIKKVIHLIPDEHRLVETRLGCVDGQGMDIKDYLVERLTESRAKRIDFFMEATQEDIDTIGPPGAECTGDKCRQTIRDTDYINKVSRVFSNLAREGEAGPLNKIRLHPFKISLELTTLNHKFNHPLLDPRAYRKELVYNYYHLRWYVYSEEVRESLEMELTFQSIMLSVLSGEEISIPTGQAGGEETSISPDQTSSKPRHFSAEGLRSVISLINKIRNGYTHPEVKQGLEVWIEKAKHYLKIAYDACNNLKLLLQEVRLACDKVGSELFLDRDSRLGYTTEVPPTVVANLVFKITEYLEMMDYCGYSLYPSLMMEVYLLRRLLDQDEITDALIYTGDYHSLSLLAILIKSFGFEITHLAHTNLPNQSIDSLNHTLREAHPGEYITILKPANRFNRDCVDVSGMPGF